MNDQVLKAALAGLMHDIGKVVQRAREDPWKMPADTIEEGQPVHAAWSMQFANLVPPEYRQPVLMGTYHHKPEKNPAEDPHLSYLVALADKLSAGERSDKSEENKQYPQQMASIFNRIFVDQLSTKENYYLPLQPLRMQEEYLFPSTTIQSNPSTGYQSLATNLEKAATRNPHTLEDYLEHFLSAMQQNTWCVPSAYYYSIPDVSLYDHSRMTAALAACLVDLPTEEVINRLSAVERVFQNKATQQDHEMLAEPAVLLLGGDISGIQDFIYTISARGAAKTLRGRSFYLQLLTEAVLRFVLNQLELPYSNVIYTGGGHFYLLAPLSAQARLLQLRQNITRKLLRHHGTSLYLALAAASIPYNGFQKGQLPIHWNEMHRQLNRVKQRRYVELEQDLYDQVFAPHAHAGNQEDHCAVCGEQRANTSPLEGDDEGGRVCNLCASFDTQLGKYLPETHTIALGIGTPQESQPHTALDALAEFGLYVRLLTRTNQVLDFKQDPVQRVILWSLSDQQHPVQTPGFHPVHWLRYTVNQVPEKDFNELQDASTGIKRLGVLRMDMDNLGLIFQQGFGKDSASSIATLSRLSTLSLQISIFFEGWVKKIIESQPFLGSDGKPLIYSVYAGGDDLFLIGPWDRIPELAQTIHRDFNRYVNHHPACHISGGMAFIHGKYPLYQAAEDAGDSLDLAKSLDGKNAFAFLDKAWKWGQFAEISSKQEQLVRLTSELGGPKSILQILQQLAAAEEEARKKHEGKPVWGPWMWRGNYMITRLKDRENNERLEIIKSIDNDLKASMYANLQPWGVAARWAQLFVRTQDNKKEEK